VSQLSSPELTYNISRHGDRAWKERPGVGGARLLRRWGCHGVAHELIRPKGAPHVPFRPCVRATVRRTSQPRGHARRRSSSRGARISRTRPTCERYGALLNQSPSLLCSMTAPCAGNSQPIPPSCTQAVNCTRFSCHAPVFSHLTSTRCADHAHRQVRKQSAVQLRCSRGVQYAWSCDAAQRQRQPLYGHMCGSICIK